MLYLEKCPVQKVITLRGFHCMTLRLTYYGYQSWPEHKNKSRSFIFQNAESSQG